MAVPIAFTDAAISEFCRVTHDDNYIHDGAIMRERYGKLAIVPGLLTFSYAASAAGRLLAYSNRADIYFRALHSGELIVPGFSLPRGDTLESRVSAFRKGEDVLQLDEQRYTRLYTDNGYRAPCFDGVRRCFALEPDELEAFAGIMDREGNDITGFLFSFAQSSRALLASLRSPESPQEEELHYAVKEAGPGFPVYLSLQLHIPGPIRGAEAHQPIEFVTLGETAGKRDVSFRVRCEQNGAVLYTSSALLRIVPERVIIERVARDIPNSKKK